MTFTYASACDGIGAVHVAWQPLGWRCAWTAEIEPFPAAVVEKHWGFPNLGNILNITEADLASHGRLDLLVAGTPCQSFSVAGLRGGLADARGNLALRFFQLAAIARPRWMVWENVPGVLSSNGGRDFGAILRAMAELGYGWAYRVLDAQHFGVPQRRRRVFVVGHLGSWQRAAAVLFERHSLSGNPPPRREAGARVARSIKGGARGGGGQSSSDGQETLALCLNGEGMRRQDFETETLIPETGGFFDGVTGTLNAHGKAAGSATQQDAESGMLVTHSLRADGHDASEDGTGRGTPIIPIDMRQASRGETMTNNRPGGSSGGAPGTGVGEAGDPAPSLSTDHTPAVAYQQHGSDVGQMGTLRRGNGSVQGGIPFLPVELTRKPNESGEDAETSDGEATDAARKRNGQTARSQNRGKKEPAANLPSVREAGHQPERHQPREDRGGARHNGLSRDVPPKGSGDGRFPAEPEGRGTQGAVAFIDAYACRGSSSPNQSPVKTDGLSDALDTTGPGAVAFQTRIARNGRGQPSDVTCALTSCGGGTHADSKPHVAYQSGGGMAVRRLTPRECERLQGFPDDWTLIPFRGKPAADGPRYRSIGNSMATPVMRWIGERIAMVEAIP